LEEKDMNAHAMVYQELDTLESSLIPEVLDFIGYLKTRYKKTAEKQKSTMSITEQLNQYYGTHTNKLDDTILQTQYDLVGEGDW
jgi:glutaredoxin 2